MAITLDGTNGVTTPDLTVDTDTLTVDATNNRVGIGTSSPAYTLDVSGTAQFSGDIKLNNGTSDSPQVVLVSSGYDDWYWDNASGHLRAINGSTERMRINSDGRIGVASSGLTAVQFAMEINGQSWFAVWDDDAGNDKFRVASSGNVQNSNNSYGAISDQKLKENIVDTTNKLEDLKRVQIRNYNFIGDSQKQIGVIAQELETVFPSMVEEHSDLDEDGNDLGTVTKSVKYSVFVPILIKSLQEQQTIIEDLKTRIEALEAGV